MSTQVEKLVEGSAIPKSTVRRVLTKPRENNIDRSISERRQGGRGRKCIIIMKILFKYYIVMTIYILHKDGHGPGDVLRILNYS